MRRRVGAKKTPVINYERRGAKLRHLSAPPPFLRPVIRKPNDLSAAVYGNPVVGLSSLRRIYRVVSDTGAIIAAPVPYQSFEFARLPVSSRHYRRRAPTARRLGFRKDDFRFSHSPRSVNSTISVKPSSPAH